MSMMKSRILSRKKIKTMNDEMFQRILDEIKSSSKTINVLPLDEAARQAMKEKYRIRAVA